MILDMESPFGPGALEAYGFNEGNAVGIAQKLLRQGEFGLVEGTDTEGNRLSYQFTSQDVRANPTGSLGR
jgi:hypothetical protein